MNGDELSGKKRAVRANGVHLW